jgi:hypothetical protein
VAFDIRAQLRNIIASQAINAATVNSAAHTCRSGKGVRFYVYTSSVTAGGGTDQVNLIAYPPDGGAAVVLAGFSKANLLATAGRYVFDFYPGETGSIVGSGITFAGASGYGAAAVSIPISFGVQIVLGAGNTATVAVDGEMLP